MVSKDIFTLVQWWPPNCLIATSKFTWSWTQRAYLYTCSIMASSCIFKLARSPRRSISPFSQDFCYQVCTIMASLCIFTLAQSYTQSVSLSSPDYCLQVYLWIHPITASNGLSHLAQSQPRSVSLSLLNPDFQMHLEFLSCTACSHSGYHVCRWVGIFIPRYTDECTHWIHEF